MIKRNYFLYTKKEIANYDLEANFLLPVKTTTEFLWAKKLHWEHHKIYERLMHVERNNLLLFSQAKAHSKLLSIIEPFFFPCNVFLFSSFFKHFFFLLMVVESAARDVSKYILRTQYSAGIYFDEIRNYSSEIWQNIKLIPCDRKKKWKTENAGGENLGMKLRTRLPAHQCF